MARKPAPKKKAAKPETRTIVYVRRPDRWWQFKSDTGGAAPLGIVGPDRWVLALNPKSGKSQPVMLMMPVPGTPYAKPMGYVRAAQDEKVETPTAHDIQFDKEEAAFKRLLPSMLVLEGKFAVVHKEKLVGVYDTWEAAINVGYKTAGLEAFFVKKIEAIETVCHL